MEKKSQSHLIDYIKEAIKFELNVSSLYDVFAKKFEQDYLFWSELSSEEVNHASLLKGILPLVEVEQYPFELIPEKLDEILNDNEGLRKTIEVSKKIEIRAKAFELALEVENLATERHYQEFMAEDSDSAFLTVIKKLNKADINHASRIESYMKTNVLKSE